MFDKTFDHFHVLIECEYGYSGAWPSTASTLWTRPITMMILATMMVVEMIWVDISTCSTRKFSISLLGAWPSELWNRSYTATCYYFIGFLQSSESERHKIQKWRLCKTFGQIPCMSYILCDSVIWPSSAITQCPHWILVSFYKLELPDA